MKSVSLILLEPSGPVQGLHYLCPEFRKTSLWLALACSTGDVGILHLFLTIPVDCKVYKVATRLVDTVRFDGVGEDWMPLHWKGEEDTVEIPMLHVRWGGKFQTNSRRL